MNDQTLNTRRLSCPRCHTHLQAATRYCPQCGVNLGLLAASEAHRINKQPFKPTNIVTPEKIFPRIGDYLVRRGLVSQEILNLALAYQDELATEGNPKLLGQILVENGFLNREELDLAVTEQMIALKTTLEKYNKQLEDLVEERTTELAQALSRLGELDQMKANFVATISHEFYTPLAHIMGDLEIISQEGSQRAINKRLDNMLVATNRLRVLIDELQQYAAAISGKLTIKPEPILIAEPLQTAVSHKKPLALKRNITLNAKIEPNLPLVQADQEKITWVIEQLIDNAIKFTPNTGQVVAYARPQTDMVRIDVVDTGIGIPKERISELFLSFHQLEEASRRHHEGLGLGLALAQKILAAHDSQIEVRSREGIGSHFGFLLPRYVT